MKTKWENLKRDAKRLSKNDYSHGGDDFRSHTATLISQMKEDPVVSENFLDSVDAISGKIFECH